MASILLTGSKIPMVKGSPKSKVSPMEPNSTPLLKRGEVRISFFSILTRESPRLIAAGPKKQRFASATLDIAVSFTALEAHTLETPTISYSLISGEL